MGLAKMIESGAYELPRQDFEEALLKLSDMARISEQKLTLKIDNTIQQKYENQITKIKELTGTLETIKK